MKGKKYLAMFGLIVMSVGWGFLQMRGNQSHRLFSLADDVEALSFCEGSATIKAGPFVNNKYYIYCNGTGSCSSTKYGVTVQCSGSKVKDGIK